MEYCLSKIIFTVYMHVQDLCECECRHARWKNRRLGSSQQSWDGVHNDYYVSLGDCCGKLSRTLHKHILSVLYIIRTRMYKTQWLARTHAHEYIYMACIHWHKTLAPRPAPRYRPLHDHMHACWMRFCTPYMQQCVIAHVISSLIHAYAQMVRTRREQFITDNETRKLYIICGRTVHRRITSNGEGARAWGMAKQDCRHIYRG